ncbi:MAG: YbhB/YbcL family Raf kinase inhibitor-like protein [Parcubacteria group bacterium]
MKLKSLDFSHNDLIPARFTCDGKNISPHLTWYGAPEKTLSFALSCKDPDAPGGNFDHWLIMNIPRSVTEIPQGQTVGEEVNNDFRQTNYGGPCPPAGTHRYVFTLYALSVERLDGVTHQNFSEKVGEHALDSAKLTGLYKR